MDSVDFVHIYGSFQHKMFPFGFMMEIILRSTMVKKEKKSHERKNSNAKIICSNGKFVGPQPKLTFRAWIDNARIHALHTHFHLPTNWFYFYSFNKTVLIIKSGYFLSPCRESANRICKRLHNIILYYYWIGKLLEMTQTISVFFSCRIQMCYYWPHRIEMWDGLVFQGIKR